MNKFMTFIVTMLGLNCSTACSNDAFENANVDEFAKLISRHDVQILDVRTAEEYAEGHIEGAVNIDVKESTFIQLAKEQLTRDMEVAVYCRSGRRSAMAAGMLAAEGFKATNLTGGILEWQKTKPTTTTASDVFTTKSGRLLRIDALMHASLRIVVDGKVIVVDPVGKLGERTVDYAAMPKADYIFVTHEHFDHFDQTAINTLKKEETKIVSNARCANMMGYGMAMANGDKADIDSIMVEAVPAYNTTAGHTQFHPKGRDNGYVLTIDGLRIYIAGDTEDVPEMDNLKNIDIAFLPCNQPYTMTVEQTVNAARRIKPRILYPYHYSQTDVTVLPQMLKDDGIEVRLRKWEGEK